MKKFLIINIILFLGLSVFGKVDNDGTDWTHVAPNNYVDYGGVVGLEEIYGFTFMLKAFNKGQYEPVNGRQILYTLSQYTLNCSNRTYKIGIMDSYDDNGYFVNGDYNKYAKFQPIVEGTAVDTIANKLCR